MASRTSFDKLQRERRKKAKAAAKRERRQQRSKGSDEQAEPQVPEPNAAETLTPEELLNRVESLQARLERGAISLDEFEEEKAELTQQLAEIMD